MKIFCNIRGIKRGTALLLCLIIALTFVLGACKDEKEGATADSAATNNAVDTQTFVFSDGITIGGADVSGMAFDAAFQAVKAVADKSVKDFELTVKANDKSFTYGKSDFQWSFDIEEALNTAAKYCEETTSADSAQAKKDFALKAEVVAESVDAIVNKIAKQVNVAAVDSTFSVDGDKVNISREKTGVALDKDDLKKKITKELSLVVSENKAKAEVEATLNEVKPKRTFESMDGEIKLLSTYSTYSSNTENGNHNMNLALMACDGSVINPGEVWSFNGCTGNSNLTSLGYLPATVIMNGKFEQGIGGGICQASSTIYNAALLANMTIEERYCHQYQSAYVPAGRDATIDYPYLDLKLSNPTDYPMYMQCYMDGVELTVNIYGWDDPSFDYIEIESSVYGATEEGYHASAERVYYLDGKEVGREGLHSSWYDYPKDDDETTAATTAPKETKPKPTKPKETKPAATDPKESKPVVTNPPATVPGPTTPATTVTEPVEQTTHAPAEVTTPTSQNTQQIVTATVNY